MNAGGLRQNEYSIEECRRIAGGLRSSDNTNVRRLGEFLLHHSQSGESQERFRVLFVEDVMMHDACLDVFHTILGKLQARGKPAVLCQIVEVNVLVDGVMSSCLYLMRSSNRSLNRS